MTSPDRIGSQPPVFIIDVSPDKDRGTAAANPLSKLLSI